METAIGSVICAAFLNGGRRDAAASVVKVSKPWRMVMSAQYKTFADVAKALGRTAPVNDKPVVCIQGLGFVGTAMAVAVASAVDAKGEHCFNVIGVDLPNKLGQSKVDGINTGALPIESTDKKLEDYFAKAYARGNLVATTDPAVYRLASAVMVDVHLDVIFGENEYDFALAGFKNAIATLGQYINPDCLVVVETTVPPGTCVKVVVPTLEEAFRQRGLAKESVLVAHSYERVMPGSDYLDSIINFWRVYSGHTEAAAQRCEELLSKVINVAKYPLTRLHSTTASETAKVLENSYRAMNIAFMEEWGRFAEAVGIDLFEVVNAIRKRPTHNNIRQPGFGVGGYCLTKDPLFALLSTRKFYDMPELNFPFCTQAVKINQHMPLVTLDKVEAAMGGRLAGKRILLMGVSYRQDVGDTRYSPAEAFVIQARKRGAEVICHDPLLDYWPELELPLSKEIPSPASADVVVFALPHQEYLQLDLGAWFGAAKPLVMDANSVLNKQQRTQLREKGLRVMSIGRGEGL
ncbi:MAG: nucleotide sugar dehydrogenase [Pseudomonadota bacterium]